MQTKYKHITFEKQTQDPKKKTSSWGICHNETDDFLGEIKWHGPWRQYCFFPEDTCLFSKGCLNDIVHFITQLMDERKKSGKS